MPQHFDEEHRPAKVAPQRNGNGRSRIEDCAQSVSQKTRLRKGHAVGRANESGISRRRPGKFLRTVDDRDVHATFLQKPGAGESDDPRSNDHYVFGRAWIGSVPRMITHRSSLKNATCAILHIRISQPIFKVAAKYESGDRGPFPVMF